ncbi:hypothetical protein GcM1_077002 [Golovinomyces cichoracearum]|uniref:Uncharacterized protein n=1 Tax=Golovinomyces cichoracearum TaxID=62708 RepID=A0A420JC86_9PEZI|nr:hypothetical protein GcM1_077002 [Golovinomyces cichoracearum]
MCNRSFYKNDNVRAQAVKYCNEKKKNLIDDPQRGISELPVYTGGDKLFENEGALYQIPLKKFMVRKAMKNLLRKFCFLFS